MDHIADLAILPFEKFIESLVATGVNVVIVVNEVLFDSNASFFAIVCHQHPLFPSKWSQLPSVSLLNSFRF